jgi:hypothetical protein
MDLYSWENQLQISNGRFSIAMFDCWLIKKEGSNWSNTFPEDMVNETLQAEMLRNRGICHLGNRSKMSGSEGLKSGLEDYG